jgi:hypothetical protein
MNSRRCRCNHNQPCAHHPGSSVWLATPIGGCAWRGDEDPTRLATVSFWPASWQYLVPEGGNFFRFSLRCHRLNVR